MADTIDIFTLKIDIDEAIASTADLADETAKLKKVYDDTRKSTEASTEEVVQAKAEYDAMNKQLKANQRELTNLTALRGKEIKTIEQGRNALAVLNKQWAQQASLYGANSKQADALAKKSLELRERLKELEKSVGDNTRNVGNYAEGFKEALGQSNLFTRAMSNLAEATKIFGPVISAVKEEVKETAATMAAASAGTQGMSRAQKAATITSNLLTGALKIFKIALISTGVGALVVALGSLVAWFSKTQEGIDFVNKALAGFSAGVDVIIDRLSTFGGALTKLFSGDFTGAFEDMEDAVRGVGDELQREINLAIELENQLQQIQKAEVNLDIRRSAANRRLKELNLIIEDLSKPYEERIKAAQEFQRIETELVDEEVANQKRRVAAMLGFAEVTEEVEEMIRKIGEEGVSLDALGLSKSTVEDAKEFQGEISKLFDLETASFERQVTNNNKLNTIVQQRNAAIAKINADRQKEIERLEKEEQKRLEKASKDEAEELKRIRAFEDKKRELENQIQLENAASEEERAIIKAEQDYQKEVLQLERLQLTEEEKTELLLLLTQNRREAIEAIEEEFDKKEIDRIKKANEVVVKEEEKNAQVRENVASTLSGILIGLLGDSLGAKLAAVAIEAGIQAGLVAINSSSAQASNLAAATAPGPPQNIPLIATALGQNAVTAANSKAAIAKILTSAALRGIGTLAGGLSSGKKFASGGMLSGPSHAEGGIPTPYGELEGGEAIINKRSMRNPYLRSLASAINVMGGGRKFEDGGITGRSIGESPSASAMMNLIDYDVLAAKMAAANASLPRPIVLVEDINTGQARVAEVESGANIGG